MPRRAPRRTHSSDSAVSFGTQESITSLASSISVPQSIAYSDDDRSTGNSLTSSSVPTDGTSLRRKLTISRNYDYTSSRVGNLYFFVICLLIVAFSWISVERSLLQVSQKTANDIFDTEFAAIEADSNSSLKDSTGTTDVDDDYFRAKESSKNEMLRFCTRPEIKHNNVTLKLLYQCRGNGYENFQEELHSLASKKKAIINQSKKSLSDIDSRYWGQRIKPLPTNRTVLLLGNSHLRQISKTIACQYSDQIANIHPTSTADVFLIQFGDGGLWISITNSVLMYSLEWKELIEEVYLKPLIGNSFSMNDIDAVVFGKVTRYAEAKGTNFEATMKHDQQAYYGSASIEDVDNITSSTTSLLKTIDFELIPPPYLVDVARAFPRIPIVSVPMFSKTDQLRAVQERTEYFETFFNSSQQHDYEKVSFVITRQYIDALGLECGSDDKYIVGTCHEDADHQEVDVEKTGEEGARQQRNASDMHRCAGSKGGHADLVAWSLLESLWNRLS